MIFDLSGASSSIHVGRVASAQPKRRLISQFIFTICRCLGVSKRICSTLMTECGKWSFLYLLIFQILTDDSSFFPSEAGCIDQITYHQQIIRFPHS